MRGSVTAPSHVGRKIARQSVVVALMALALALGRRTTSFESERSSRALRQRPHVGAGCAALIKAEQAAAKGLAETPSSHPPES